MCPDIWRRSAGKRFGEVHPLLEQVGYKAKGFRHISTMGRGSWLVLGFLATRIY